MLVNIIPIKGQRSQKTAHPNAMSVDDLFVHYHPVKFKFSPGNALQLLHDNFVPLNKADVALVKSLIELKHFRSIKAEFNHDHVKSNFEVTGLPIAGIFHDDALKHKFDEYLRSEVDTLKKHRAMEIMRAPEIIFASTTPHLQHVVRSNNVSLSALLDPILFNNEPHFLSLISLPENKDKTTYTFLRKDQILKHERMFVPVKHLSYR